MRFIISLAINLSLLVNFSEAAAISKIIAHSADQENRKSNDPKALFGEKTYGQTFIPEHETLSFLRIGAGRISSAAESNDSSPLELRLWKCAEDYKSTKTNLPLVTIATKQPLYFMSFTYFKVDTAVSPRQPYYWEIAVPGDPLPCWTISYQYTSKDPYANGAFVIEGERWGTCDFNFSTYYPQDLVDQTQLNNMPEIIEIYFNENMDTEKTKIFMKEADKLVKNIKIFWTEKNKATIIIGKNQDAGNKHCTLEINTVTASGKQEKQEISFSIPEKKEVIPNEAQIKEEAAASKYICSVEKAERQRKLKGIIRASVENIKMDRDACNFSLDSSIDPITGMQTGFEQISPETLDGFTSHNINMVSTGLPNFLEKPELLPQVKEKIELIHQKGLLVFWLPGLAPAGYDKALLGNEQEAHKVAWNGKIQKVYCLNNPKINEATISNLNKYLKTLNDNNIFIDALALNEPLREWGEFCYCAECKKRFEKEFGTPMPLPVNMSENEVRIPINWPFGIPKEKYIKDGDRQKWENMSKFYCEPMTERIFSIFKCFRENMPLVSCQFTTITDVAPFYGVDYPKLLSSENLDGIQPAIYWRLGNKSATIVGSQHTASKFMKPAREKKLSCYYWLQGYDAGDHSAPLRPGDIKTAVNEAFGKGVDGIVIWSYLNPILGPWDKPYHWPEYFDELKEALATHLRQFESSGNFTVKKGAKSQFTMTKDGIIFDIEAELSNDNKLSVSVKSDGYRTYKNNFNTGRN